jgi:hypothetical protein
MPSVSKTWGTVERERRLSYPCDNLVADPDSALFRGVTVNASTAILFRWLCQMRVAPYSYDWIDHRGRQSPRELTPGLEDLAPGQEVMEIFTLESFERDRHLTIRLKPRSGALKTFGDIAVSYLVVPVTEDSCRLLVKLTAKHPPGIWGRAIGSLLPWGDLIMMRRQLLNLKQLAERSHADAV